VLLEVRKAPVTLLLIVVAVIIFDCMVLLRVGVVVIVEEDVGRVQVIQVEGCSSRVTEPTETEATVCTVTIRGWNGGGLG